MIPATNTYDRRRVTNCDEFNIHDIYMREFGFEYSNIIHFKSASDGNIVFPKLETTALSHYPFKKLQSKYIDNATLRSCSGNDYFVYVINHCNAIVFVETDYEEIEVSVFFSTHDVADIIDGIKEVMPSNEKKTQNKFSVICYNDGYFFTKALDLDNFGVEAVNIGDCYNEDFLEVASHITDQLEKRTKGIVLLHGEPGTGKTSFLKHLIATIANKEFIYLPPDMAHLISKPEFFTFLLDHKKAILLIEDAENVLKEREAGDGQAVSNLLNVSDGILGSALKFQAICTLNSPIEQVDQALLRPGRLIASYKFGKLSVDKANILLKKVIHEDAITEKELTLAEVFNFDQKRYSNHKEKQKLGFT
jgi:hypothetical protein